MLTPEQIEKRRGRLTASAVGKLMKGDQADIMRLYRELRGEENAEDRKAQQEISDAFPVQLGSWTEEFHLNWLAKHGVSYWDGGTSSLPYCTITRKGWVVDDPHDKRFAATLDGWIEEIECPVECKHTGGNEPMETLCARYWPQCTWQMMVTGAKRVMFTVIMGNKAPVQELIHWDAEYAAEMRGRATQLMEFVERGIPPFELPEIKAPGLANRELDMTQHNQWAVVAYNWLQTKGAADDNVGYSKTLKELIPADVKRAFGHGVVITRDKRGYLSLRAA